ncbi:MAG: ribosomal protein S18-alanine N-acetyltransferase [Clostridiales bacterium]|nr:ribosomal protein S18-alanine N-acetyltransferase [Clostridiales bacterium]
MNVTIIPMNTSHITALTELEKRCFTTPWSKISLQEELINPLSHFLVAVAHGHVIGYIGTQEVVGESYISNIAVLPEHRRKGVAQTLLDRAIQGAIERGCVFITLEVRVSNTAAISLYEKNGFLQAGRRKSFYRHPDEDALIMTKHFNNSAQMEGDRK